MRERSEYPRAPEGFGLFPPWGRMDIDADNEASANPNRPPDWDGDEDSFESWFEETLKIITDNIWPSFDFNAMRWSESGAKDRMEDLTRADQELHRIIYTRQPLLFEQPVDPPGSPLSKMTHHQLFSEEDLFVHNWGNSYDHYDPLITVGQIQQFQAIMKLAFTSKVGGGILRFKRILQRPRPYQMAAILGVSDFSYFEALSADTPSICHGHCAQGLLLVGAVMEQILLNGGTVTRSLEQFAVDIGDRRVMARVHYPSDAICSWLIVLRMANHVFRTPEVKEHIWQAINRSRIYRLIRCHGGGIYQPLLGLLEEEAMPESA